MRNRIGAERGWGPTSRGASRFDLKYSAGTLRDELMHRSIELYGREVIPLVRQLLGEKASVGAGA
jgi:hypothetical protein